MYSISTVFTVFKSVQHNTWKLFYGCPQFLQCSKVYNTILESYFMVVLGFFSFWFKHFSYQQWGLERAETNFRMPKVQFCIGKTSTPVHTHAHTHPPTHQPTHQSTHMHLLQITDCTLPSFGHFFTKRCMLKECFLLLNM